MSRAKRPRDSKKESPARRRRRYSGKRTAAADDGNTTTPTPPAIPETTATTTVGGADGSVAPASYLLATTMTCGEAVDRFERLFGSTLSIPSVPRTCLIKAVPSRLQCKGVFRKLPKEFPENFVEALKSKVNKAAQTMPACVAFAAILGDKGQWRPYLEAVQDEDIVTKTKRFSEIINQRYGVTYGDSLAKTYGGNDYYEFVMFYLKKAYAIKGYDCPLNSVIHNNDIIACFAETHHVVQLNDYLPQSLSLKSRWDTYTASDELAGYWVMPKLYHNRLMHRNNEQILFGLTVTETVKAVKQQNGCVVIGGDSGSGKTCALFAAGTKEQLHIVVLADDLMGSLIGNPAVTTGQVCDQVRTYVHKFLNDALSHLFRSYGEVDVMLHVDEAGIASGNGPLLRALIRSTPDLLQPKEQEWLWLKIKLVLAGTGLEELHTGGTGSLAGWYTMIVAKPPDSCTLSDILTSRFSDCQGSQKIVSTLLRRPEFTRVVATNHRLLRFVLRHLHDGIMTVMKDATTSPQDNKMLASYRQHFKYSGVKGFVLPDVAEAVRELLPHACTAGAMSFVGANGLKNVVPLLRQALIRTAHVAYLKRTVLVLGDQTQYDAVKGGLENAGFTPELQLYDPKYPSRASWLLEASLLGLYSTTKKETNSAGEGLAVHKSDKQLVVVPGDRAPLIMSAGCRMLPRLLNGTLFKASQFEDVTFELAREALDSVAVAEGGCTYRTLLAAVCGVQYGLPVTKLSPAPWEKPIFDDTLSFSRAITVRLPFQLSDPTDLRRRLLIACGDALLESELSTEVPPASSSASPSTAATQSSSDAMEQLRRALDDARGIPRGSAAGESAAAATPVTLKDVALPRWCTVRMVLEANSTVKATKRLQPTDRVVLPSRMNDMSLDALAVSLGIDPTALRNCNKGIDTNLVKKDETVYVTVNALTHNGTNETVTLRDVAWRLQGGDALWEYTVEQLVAANPGLNVNTPLSDVAKLVLPRRPYPMELSRIAAGVRLSTDTLRWCNSHLGGPHKITDNIPLVDDDITVQPDDTVCVDSTAIQRQVTALRDLQRLVANVMFILVPREMSPSPDRVLLSIGSVGKHGYLAAQPCKRLTATFLYSSQVFQELQNCGHGAEPFSVAKEIRRVLEELATGACATKTEMKDIFIALSDLNMLAGNTHKPSDGSYRVHYYQHHVS